MSRENREIPFEIFQGAEIRQLFFQQKQQSQRTTVLKENNH